MADEPGPPPAAPLASAVDEAVGALGRALRREVRRTLLGIALGLLSGLLLVVVALGFAVAGVMRLGDALGQLCGAWFGDQALGDLAVGVGLLAVPLVGALLLRLRSWW